MQWLFTSHCTDEPGVQIQLLVVCSNGFPIHARSRRFSLGSPFSSRLFKLGRCIACCINFGIPLEIILTTRAILGVYLNQNYYVS